MGADMEKRHAKSDRPEPWYRKGISVVLLAGAVAGAAVAVSGAWDHFFGPDEEDRVTITSVEYLHEATMSQYMSAYPDTADMAPAGNAAGELVVAPAIAPVPTATVAPRRAPQRTPSPSTSASPEPSESPAVETPAVAPTQDRARRPNQSPSPTQSSTETPTSGHQSIKDYLDEVSHSSALDDFVTIAPDRVKQFMPIEKTLISPGSQDARDAAAALRDSLKGTDVSSSGGLDDPNGHLIVVRMNIDGRAKEPMWLVWELNGDTTEQNQDWSTSHFGLNVVATSVHDRGVGTIWVPDLAAPGGYTVTVRLLDLPDHAPLEVGEPLRIENP